LGFLHTAPTPKESVRSFAECRLDRVEQRIKQLRLPTTSPTVIHERHYGKASSFAFPCDY
jgi:hypothetical protein